jgi:hypothetical protein
MPKYDCALVIYVSYTVKGRVIVVGRSKEVKLVFILLLHSHDGIDRLPISYNGKVLLSGHITTSTTTIIRPVANYSLASLRIILSIRSVD